MKIVGKYKKILFWIAIILILLAVGFGVNYYVQNRLRNISYESNCNWVSDPRTISFPNGKTISVRIADDALERTNGLSGNSNPTDEEKNMLFIFDTYGIQPMWMKNMLFDLDMIWLDNDYRIVHLEKNIKFSSYAVEDSQLKIYQNTNPAKYVLEVVAGVADANKLIIGDQIKSSDTKMCITS